MIKKCAWLGSLFILSGHVALCSPTDTTASSTAVTPAKQSATSTAQRLGLLLPLLSPTYGRAAHAVKDGFMAAAQIAGQSNVVKIYAHDDAGLLKAYQQAHADRIEFMVGPMTRDDLKLLINETKKSLPTLALNSPDDIRSLPSVFYTFTLAIEAEAQQLAKLAQRDGRETIAIIGSGTALQQRLQDAFSEEWQRHGGQILARYEIDLSPQGLRKIRLGLEEFNPNGLLLALDSQQTKIVRPYLSAWPAYSSSQIYEGQSNIDNREFNNIRFIEMPWLTQPDHAAVMAYPRANLGGVTLERLYALGIDAFRLAWQLLQGDAPETIVIDGVTGRISQHRPQQFVREGNILTFRDGKMLLLDAP